MEGLWGSRGDDSAAGNIRGSHKPHQPEVPWVLFRPAVVMSLVGEATSFPEGSFLFRARETPTW